MKISIAMATYNGGKYLHEQLQSFVDQTRQPDELVITDDGSTDNTIAIIEEFARTSSFDVIFSRNETNLGYAGNFNAALLQTTGDLVLLSDQDDVWFPEKIAFLEKVAADHPEKLLLINDAALTDGSLNEVGLTKLGQIRSAGLGEHRFVTGCYCAVRRELLEICLPIPMGYRAHDVWIVKFADGLDSKLIVERVMQYHRRHSNNASDFIASRTRRATRWTLLGQKFSSLANKSEPQLDSHIEQLQLFSQGVERAIRCSSSQYTARLENLLHTTQQLIQVSVGRIAIRRKKLHCRIFAAVVFLCNGHYRHASGLWSAARDIAG